MKKSTKMKVATVVKYSASLLCSGTLMTMGAIYATVGVGACIADKKLKKEYLFTSAVGTMFGVASAKLASVATDALFNDYDAVVDQRKAEKEIERNEPVPATK